MPEPSYPYEPAYEPDSAVPYVRSAPYPYAPDAAYPGEPPAAYPYEPPVVYPYEPPAAYPGGPGVAFAGPQRAYPYGSEPAYPYGPERAYPYAPEPEYPPGPGAAGYPYEPDGGYEPDATYPYAPGYGAPDAPSGEAPYPPGYGAPGATSGEPPYPPPAPPQSSRRGPAAPAPGYPYALDAAPASSPPASYPPAPRNGRAPSRPAADPRGGLAPDDPRYQDAPRYRDASSYQAASRYQDAPGTDDSGYGAARYPQVRARRGQNPARYGREAADYGGTAPAPNGYPNVTARPGAPSAADLGAADPPGSAFGPGGAYVPGQVNGAGGAYAPGGPGYEFGYLPVPEPVEPYSAGPAGRRPPDFADGAAPDFAADFGPGALAGDETIVAAGRTRRAPAAPGRGGPGYEFGYAQDASPPGQDDLLALPPGGEPGWSEPGWSEPGWCEPGRRAGDGAARSEAGYTYAPPMTPPSGPPGSGPPGFEFPGSGRPRTPRAGQSPRRPLLALPAGAGNRAGTARPGDAGPGVGGRDRDWDGGGRPDEHGRYDRDAQGRYDQGRSGPAGSRWGWLRALVFSPPEADGTAEHGRALPPPLSAAGIKRWAVRAALPTVSMVAVGIAAVATFGGGNGGAGPSPATLSVGFPPATAAGTLFSTTPGDVARGISQSLTQVASSGSQVVAVGSQAGARIGRAQFFESANGGQTWRLGTEQAADGGDPAPGHAATLIAGGQGQWAALGPSAIWTSHDGVAWTLASTQGIAPLQGGDQVNVLRRTATGFIAVGENVPAGNPAAAAPVVWTSANGATWRRIGAAQLHLTADGRPGALTSAAADGMATVIAGVVTTNATRSARVWRSTNGGATWSAVNVPVSNGATAASVAVAATANGFVAVRPGRARTGASAVVFTSADGAAWKFGATITGQGGAGLSLTSVEGSPAGAVITGTSGGSILAFTSTNGTTWRPDGALASAAAGTVSGVAVTTGGAVVAAGSATAGPLGQQPALTVDNAGRLTPVSFAGIPGAVQPEVAVNGIAADGSQQVAVGSANGFPATWFSANAGTTWTRGTGAPASVLNRPGLQELSGVVHGSAGWVAAGGVQSAAAAHPVVVTSAGGQTWQAADTAPVFAGAGVFTVGVAAGRGGYVIVGRQAVAGQTVAAAWWSAGLTGWQRGTDAAAGALDGPGVSRQMLAATADAGGFVAVGAAGTRPAAWISANGRTWRAVTLALPMNSVRAQLQQVTVNGRRIVAVGMSATSGGQTAPFTALSVNGGATWTESLLPSPGGPAAVSAVAATGSGFTATGTFGADGHQDVVIWTATDGLNWKTNSPAVTGLGGQGVQEITALTVSGSTLTGVGFAAAPTSETPTIWRSPIRN